MPRPKNVVGVETKHLALPRDLVVGVELELYSEVLGKVPYAAWNKLLTELLTNWLRERKEKRDGNRTLDFEGEGGGLATETAGGRLESG